MIHSMYREILRTLLVVAFVGPPILAQSPSFSIGSNFTGSNINQSGFIPPDTMGAIGPGAYVELINGRFAEYDRNGTLLGSSSLNSFWNTALSATGSGSVQSSAFDPHVMYDRHSGRWFATSDDGGSSANSGILVGVTVGSDPSSGNWRAFRLDADANNLRWADYSTFGMNQNMLTITSNMFGLTGSNASTSISVWTIPKASLISSTPSISGNQYLADTVANPAQRLVDSHGFTLHPTYDYSNSFANTSYLMSHYNSSNLQVSNLTGSVSSPTLDGNNFVGTGSRGMGDINAPQLGANDNIDAGDSRISGSPVIVNGKIWGVHTFDLNGLSRSVVYRIDAATNALEYEAVIPISDSTLWTYYPSIAVNELGNIAVAFSGSNDNIFASTFAIAGFFDGNNVTWGTEQLLQAGLGNYSRLDSSSRNRFGDYSAIQVDPLNPTHFWTIQEFASGSNGWSTRVTELIVAVPEPSSAIAVVCSLLSLMFVRRPRQQVG